MSNGVKKPSGPAKPVKPPTAAPDVEVSAPAFDLWLQRGLHQLYDDVAAEPIPDELLRLIEEDRLRRGG